MSVEHYLARYAESSAALPFTPDPYEHVLCVPAFNEPADCLARLLYANHAASLLVILVANAAEDAAPNDIASTIALADHCRRHYPLLRQVDTGGHLLALDAGKRRHLLLLDYCRPGRLLPAGEGVGLARKVACDLACALIERGHVRSPWMFSTDADAMIPADYFRVVDALDAATDAAACLPFRHRECGDETVDRARLVYEASLRHYVRGLQWAGSPYAFHTVGSTLVLNHRHYALARGFPKRRAGEDFYLLNKLAKLGRIQSPAGSPLLLASRLSSRVPFGTGPALAKISALENPLHDYPVYHPQCFAYLKAALELMGRLWPLKPGANRSQLALIARGNNPGDVVNSGVLLDALFANGLEDALAHARGHSKSKAVFDRHLRQWFDAFRTLKFIHWLRDNHLGSTSLAAIRDDKNPLFAAAT